MPVVNDFPDVKLAGPDEMGNLNIPEQVGHVAEARPAENIGMTDDDEVRHDAHYAHGHEEGLEGS